MRFEIKKAYDNAAPTQTAVVRVYEKLLNRADAAPEREPRRASRVSRRLTLAAAVIAALAMLSVAGYAAYQRWFLPAPETYEPGNNGIYREHGRSDYDLADIESRATTDDPGDAPLTDEAFILKGLEILNEVGMPDVRPEQLTVVRQENLYWGREEAEVLFDNEGVRTSVRFNAETGRFLGMSGIDWQLEGAAACGSDEEAAALARRCYAALPVEQGYTMTHVEKYDAQYWSYDFSREVEPGVFNEYETVRVAINPVSGRLTGCTVFYVPLLDDHEPGQEKIGAQEAEQIVQSALPALLDGMTLTKAEVVIGLPNWNYTAYQNEPNRRASDVTRWAWELTYETPNSEFADVVVLLVDCYTGELLGGDATK